MTVKAKELNSFRLDNGMGHQANFIKAVRSRNSGDLNADILEGHRSTTLCHLANISHRTGEMSSCRQIQETLRENEVMAEAFDRFQAHLAANEVDLSNTCATLGAWVQYNPKSERIEGVESTTGLIANSLLTRNYRAPFVMPKRI